MDTVLKGSVEGPALCTRCHRNRRGPRVRRLHEGQVELGESAPCYSTTHKQPGFPSQHRSCLQLKEQTTEQKPPQPHSRDVHGPKPLTVRPDLSRTHWALYMSGGGVRELLSDPSRLSTQTTKQSTHGTTESTSRTEEETPEQSYGRPAQWHQHDVLSGEQCREKPARSFRRTRDKHLWPSKCRDTDHGAFRLY